MNGSFINCKIIGNKIIKISKEEDDYSKLIKKEIDSKNYLKYQSDLKKNNVDVANLYLSIEIFNKLIQVEEYIKGENLNNYFININNLIIDKLTLMKKILELYKRLLNSDVTVDFNFNNFIIHDDRLIYIDFIPSIYKSNIIYNGVIDEYKRIVLDKNYCLLNMISYLLKAMLSLSKEELADVLNKVLVMIDNLNININLSSDHQRFNLFNEYLNSDMNLVDFYNIYDKIKRK